jgi:hypothetical protein
MLIKPVGPITREAETVENRHTQGGDKVTV